MSDISLLFDVSGGGSISEGSGKLINEQLTSIVSKINATPFGIKMQLDQQSAKNIGMQIKSIVDTFGKLNINIGDSDGLQNLIKSSSGISGSLSKVDTSLSEIIKELTSVNTILETISSSFADSGKATVDAASNVKSLESNLRGVLDLVTQINSKNFNIQNVFEYKAKNGSGSETLELYRDKAFALLDVIKQLLDANSALGKAGGLATALNKSKLYTEYFDLSSRFKGYEEYTGSIAGASTVGTLKKTIAILTEFQSVYTRVIQAARDSGINIQLPDLSRLDEANNKIANLAVASKEAEKNFMDAVNSARDQNKQMSAAVGEVSSDAGAKNLEYLASVKNMCTDISSVLLDLRKQIESTFDFTTLHLDGSKIKNFIDEISREISTLSTSIDGAMGHYVSGISSNPNTSSISTARRPVTIPQATTDGGTDDADRKVKEYFAVLRSGYNLLTTIESSKSKWITTGADRQSLDELNTSLDTTTKLFKQGAISQDIYKEKLAEISAAYAEVKRNVSSSDAMWNAWNAEKAASTKTELEQAAGQKREEARIAEEERANEARKEREIAYFNKLEDAKEQKAAAAAKKVADAQSASMQKAYKAERDLELRRQADTNRGYAAREAIRAKEEQANDERTRKEIAAFNKAEDAKEAAAAASAKKVADAQSASMQKAYKASQDLEFRKQADINRGYAERDAARAEEERANEESTRKEIAYFEQLEEAKTKSENGSRDSLLKRGYDLLNTISSGASKWTGASPENVSALKNLNEQIDHNIKLYENGFISQEKYSESLGRISKEYSKLSGIISASHGDTAVIKKEDNIEAFNNSMAKIYAMQDRINKIVSHAGGSRSLGVQQDVNTLKLYSLTLSELKARLDSGTMTQRKFNEEVAELNAQIAETSGAISAGLNKPISILGKAWDTARKFVPHFIAGRLSMAIYRGIRSTIRNVMELDKAMTELYKVTNETDEVYKRFLDNASVRANKLGTSLVDIVNATADFARLGYSLADAETLSNAATVYKNVGDGIKDIHEASESVISTMQAFGISAKDAMTIVDKFNEVGNNFAISSQGVGEALKRSAAAMASANNTIDETIALSAAANTIVQDPVKVGTALKTMSMYLRAAKTEAEDAGESTDGMATSVSKLRDELLALTNNRVDIQIDENTFKSTYQILHDLSKEWKNLSDITQANILMKIGGKRNANIGAAILENFDVAERALESSAGAAGSAMAENEKYLDSIAGKLDRLKVASQTLSNNVVGSGTIKWVVDLSTSILRLANSMQKTKVLLPSIISSLVTIRAIRAGFKAAAGAQTVAVLTQKAIQEKQATDMLASSITSLTARQKRRIVTDIEAAISSGRVTAEEGEGILASLGLAGAHGTLSASNRGLAMSFKEVTASIPVWGWIATGISILLPLISNLAERTKTSKEKMSELKEEMNSLSSDINRISSEYRSLSSSLNSIAPRFVELAAGVNKFGECVSLTKEEYAEFLDLNNQIAELFPELNLGMDENGNYMLALSYNADTLNASLERQLEIKRELATTDLASKMGDVVDNATSQDKELSNEIKSKEETYDKFKSLVEKIRGAYDSFDYVESTYSRPYNHIYQSVSDEIRSLERLLDDEYGEILSRLKDKFSVKEGWFKSVDWNSIINSEEFSFIADKLSNEISTVQKQLDGVWTTVNGPALATARLNPIYDKLNTEMQDIVANAIHNIDFGSLGLSNEASIEQFIVSHILQPLSEASPETEQRLSDAIGFKKLFDSGKKTVLEYKEFISDFSNDMDGLGEEILSGIDSMLSSDTFEEQLSTVKEGLESIYGESGATEFLSSTNQSDLSFLYNMFLKAAREGKNLTKEYIDLAIQSERAKRGSEEYAQSVEELSKKIERLKSGYEILHKSEKEMVDNGLSAETIKKLSEYTEDYLDYIYEENGVIKLNIEAWQGLLAEQSKDGTVGIISQISALQAEEMAVRANILAYKTNIESAEEARKQADAYNRIVGFGSRGNVDYNNRPILSKNTMQQYYPEFDGDWATTYDSGYYVNDKSGKRMAVVVTPILENGQVLTEAELSKYVEEELNGAEDILKADRLNLVVHYESQAEPGSDLWSTGVDGEYSFNFEEFNNRIQAYKDAHLDAYTNEQKDALDSMYAALRNVPEGYDDCIKSAEVFNSLVSQINGEFDRFSTTVSGFERVKNVVDEVSKSLKTVADIQETVSSGFTLSVDKAVEFASVYPEILNGATAAANGQITLNSDVVNSFIASKETQVRGQIDSQILELEADKVVLESKMNFAKAQLELAKEVASGKSEITKDEAMYRVNAGNAVAKALIDAGVDEATAYKLASASMADNMDEVNQIAMDVATDMQGNFDNAAYDAALSICNNMRNSQIGIANVADQAHESANAIAGMASGKVRGSSRIQGTSMSGVHVGKNSISVTNGEFTGSGFTYEEHLVELDDFISDLELDISKYEDAISNIDGKIAVLEALKSKGLGSFSSSSGKGSGGGSSGKNEETWFDKQYKEHKHLVEMEQETQADFLSWLDSAYKKAYGEGILTLDEYKKYEEEVFNGLNKIRDDAKSAFDKLVDYRENIIKKQLADDKKALDDKLKELKEFYDKQKKLLKDARDEEKYSEEQREKRDSIIDIQEKLRQLENDDSAWAQKRRIELREQLAEATKALEDFEKDKALEDTLAELDKSFSEQEDNIKKQADAIEEKLNDPNAIFNQALEEIKKNTSVTLYKDMVEYNNKYGDGNIDTINKLWESIYGPLNEYEKLFGNKYQGVDVNDETGYEAGKGKSPSIGGDIPNKPGTPNGNDKESNKPSVKKGSTVTVKKSATHFGKNSANRLMASFVPGGTYTVYEKDGNQILIGKNGVYTGWVNLSDIVGYASGTGNASAGLKKIDELGPEYVFQSKDGNRFRVFSGGEKVLNAKATDFLYTFANHGQEFFKQLMNSPDGGYLSSINGKRNIQISTGDIIIKGSADARTVSEIRRAQRENVDLILREFTRLNK